MIQAMAGPFLFLSANTPWVYALAEALSENADVTAVRFYDYATHRRLRPQWPEDKSRVRRLMVKLPPGYAGRLELFFRTFIQTFVTKERARLRRATATEPIVVCPYPYLAPWVRGVPDHNLVYYNLDDYALYNPSRAEQTARLEAELINRARVTLCLSAHQVEALRSRYPDVAHRIRHFPLGVVENFINPDPERPPPLPRTVGYVGNLTNRVDWPFFERVASLLSDAQFHVVGKLDNPRSGAEMIGWQSARDRVLDLPNVRYEGAVPQAQVREHYWRYAVNWMPYTMDHPFNVASCPTKIMDALASGRPLLSTDLPEVRLYPERIRVVRTPEEAAESLGALLRSEDHRDARRQIAFAAAHTWKCRAASLLHLLSATGALTPDTYGIRARQHRQGGKI